MEKRFIGTKELAEYLGIETETVYAWIQHRKISFTKIGRLVKFDLMDIDAWIKRNRVKAYEES